MTTLQFFSVNIHEETVTDSRKRRVDKTSHSVLEWMDVRHSDHQWQRLQSQHEMWNSQRNPWLRHYMTQNTNERLFSCFERKKEEECRPTFEGSSTKKTWTHRKTKKCKEGKKTRWQRGILLRLMKSHEDESYLDTFVVRGECHVLRRDLISSLVRAWNTQVTKHPLLSLLCQKNSS